MREIVRAGIWIGFRELVREFGGDPDSILAAAKVTPADLDNPERYLSLRAFLECQEIAAERLRRPDFGLHFGARGSLGSLDALSVAVLNAPTTRDAIETCARYVHLQNPSMQMTLSPMPRSKNEFVGFNLTMRGQPRRNQNAERIIASSCSALLRLGGPDFRIRDIWFPHARMSPISVYREVLGVTPQFNKSALGVAFSSDMLDTLQPGRNAQLRQIAESFLRTMGAPKNVGYAQRVAGVMHSLIQSGECSPPHVARALGVHERTLQRRLKVENTSFEQIKDDIRRERAEALLAQTNVSLSRIASMLDYSDSSAFTRSCRRWFDETPSQVRARLLVGKTPVRSASDNAARLHPLVVSRRLSGRNAG